MDQLVVIMLSFRTWAVRFACGALPAQGVLHPGCCFHGIVAHPPGLQRSLRIATRCIGGHACVHGVCVQVLLAEEHPSCMSSSIIPAFGGEIVHLQRGDCRAHVKSAFFFFLLFLQIFLFCEASFGKVKNNKDKM